MKDKLTDEPTPAAEVKTEEKGGDDETEDEEISSTTAVLGNIPQSLNQDFLDMLVENIVKDVDYTLEFIPDISSAVVTFQSEKGTTSVRACVCVLLGLMTTTTTNVMIISSFSVNISGPGLYSVCQFPSGYMPTDKFHKSLRYCNWSPSSFSEVTVTVPR